jgi:hypothetical protein
LLSDYKNFAFPVALNSVTLLNLGWHQIKSMKNILTLTFGLLIGNWAFAQTTFWTEDFGTGCNQGQLGDTYTGNNGSWAVSDYTSSNNAANKFYVSATEAFTGLGSCGDGCLDAALTDATLHVGGVYVEYQTFPIVEADMGASYNVGGIGGFGFQSETNIRAESPLINCSGYQNIELEFDYMEGGEGSIDDATLHYYTGSSWGVLDNPDKTVTGCPGGQGAWTHYSYNLPAIINDLANFQIGFRWVNADDGTGSDPSFAVDNITLTGDITTGINEVNDGALRIRQFDGSIEVDFTDVDEEIMVVKGYDILGQEVASSTATGSNRVKIETGNLSGVLILQIESTSGISTRKVVLR